MVDISTIGMNGLNWGFLKQVPSINKRMEAFHNTLFGIFNECFPLKRKIIFSQNEPFIDDALIKLRRKRNREYNKHRRSQKYMQLESRYQDLLSKSMKHFYRRKIHILTNIKQALRAIMERELLDCTEPIWFLSSPSPKSSPLRPNPKPRAVQIKIQVQLGLG